MDLDYFKLIDRIVDLDLYGKKIAVEAQVPAVHTIFEGHFPGFPIMPGVLLTEAMAQSSGWLILAVLKFSRMPFLAIVKEAKMRGFVSPGQVLTIDATLVHEGSGFAVAKAKGRIGKDLKCSAEITFGLAPFPGPEFRTHMDALNAKRVNIDETRFAPYVVHPLAPVSFDAQIPKKGDQRQMEAWQRIGTYAAGLALDSAGVKGRSEEHT